MNPNVHPNRIALLVLLGVAGCATTQPLHTETYSASVRSAEDAGATDVPQASLHLQLAKEELDAATKLNAAGKTEEAESLHLRAEADAELAAALSRVDAEKAEAQAAIDRVHRLQSENPYAPGGAK